MSKKDDELNANAEYQRRRVMTTYEKAIIARDTVAKNLHEQNVRDGKNTSFDSALRKATEIAHKVDRKQSEK